MTYRVLVLTPFLLQKTIKAGKKAKFDFEFTETELSIWDVDAAKWVVPSGKFTLQIGASSRDIRQTASFTL